MKRLFAIAAIVPACLSLTLACAQPSSSTMSSSQTNQMQTVVNGEVLAVRPVEIRPNTNTTRVGMITGAALGGIGGAQIGGGTASNVAGGIAGAVAGGMLGSAIQRGGQTHSGIEITVKLDSGETIAIVQAGNMNDFAVGNRVRVIGDSDEARVTR
jgi:outer membrane lipoprotein SlyB